MSASKRVARALQQVAAWATGDFQIVSELGGGPLSDTHLVERQGQRFVVRVDTSHARDFGLDRRSEADIHAAAAAAGIAPGIVFSAPDRGVFITHYVTGSTWQASDLSVAANVARLASVLRRLHRLKPMGASEYGLRDALRRYASRIGSRAAEELAREAQSLLDNADGHCSALCHNDLVAQNMIDGERLWLIDFEYAGLGDPLFDLATVVRHNRLSKENERVLISAYFDGAVAAPVRDRFEIYCAVYDRLLALWGLLWEGIDKQSGSDNRG